MQNNIVNMLILVQNDMNEIRQKDKFFVCFYFGLSVLNDITIKSLDIITDELYE